MSALLDAVSRAKRDLEGQRLIYLQRVRAAREAGHSLSELARAAGITRSGIQHLLRDTRGDTEK